MTTVAALKPPRTFIMPATPDSDGNLLFPWSWSSWVEEPRLVVESTSPAQGGQGSASFRVVRSQQIGERLNDEANATTNLRAGSYVLVTQSVTTTGTGLSTVTVPVADGTGWLGILTEINESPVGGYGPGTTARIPDGIGSATATELGASLFDQCRADGWAQIGGSGSPLPMIATPPANIQTKGGKIVGNAFLGTKDGNPAFLFARELDQLGTDEEQVWTRWRLLTHLVQFCLPPSFPPVQIVAEDGSGASGAAYVFINKTGLAAWMDRTDAPEVFDLAGLTIRGVLDLLCGSAVGLGWRVEVSDVVGTPTVRIVVYSRGDGYAANGPPKLGNPDGTANSRTLRTYGEAGERIATLEVTSDGAEQYDEVIVRGAPIIFAATFCPNDNNLEADWSAAQETAYKSATPEDRKHPQHIGVYSSFRLKRSDPQYGATRLSLPGDTGAYLPITPEVTWDGTTATITATNVDQYRPTFRFLSALPWPAGWNGAGTPTTDATGSPGESQTKPLAFAHQDSQWIPVTKGSGPITAATLSEAPEFDVSETAPALSITYDAPHILGLNSFDPDVYETGGTPPVYDWHNIVVTVAYQSVQRLEAIIRREHNGSPLAANQVRRSLILEDDTLQYVAVFAGTVLGTKDDNLDAYRVDTDTIIRNDYPAAQRWAEEAASWAFRPRDQVSASMAIATGSDLRVGMAIKSVQTDTQVREVNAIVAAITYDWSTGRMTVQTETPPAPQRRGKGGTSSPQGGPVSVELGGTVAGVTQRQASAIADLQAAVAAIPVIPAQSLGEPPALISRVTGTFTPGDVIRVSGGTWSLAVASGGDEGLALVVAVDGTGPIAAEWGLTYLDPDELILTDDTDYWLDTVAGQMTATKPATDAVLVLHHHRDGLVVVRSGGSSGVAPADIALTGPAVLGKIDAGAGVAAAITATTPNRILGWAAGAISWLQASTDMIADLAVTAAKIAALTITDAQISASAGIGWTKISKTGSSLADLATRSAADLTSGTLPDARMPAMTGDATSTAGTVALTLASVITAGGPTGSASVVPVITYDAKGRLTTVTTATITPAAIGAQPVDAGLTSLAGLTGAGYAKATATDTWSVVSPIPLADLPTLANCTVLGNPTATNPATIAALQASTNDRVLVRRSNNLTFDQVQTADIANDAIGSAQIAAGAVGPTELAAPGSPVKGHMLTYDTTGSVWTVIDAGKPYSVLGVTGSSQSTPAAMEAADGTMMARVGTSVGFKYDVTLGNATNAGKLTIRSTALSDAIVIDTALVTSSGKKLSVREVDVCDSGTAKKMLILASAPY